VIDGSQRIALERMHLVGKSGYEDDRCMGGFPAIAYQLGGFQPVEPGHVYIQQDDRELMLKDQLERLFTRIRGDYDLSKFVEDRLEGQKFVGAIVDYQDFGLTVLHGPFVSCDPGDLHVASSDEARIARRRA